MGVSTAPEQHRRGRRCRWEPLDVEALAPAASVAVMAPALTEGGPQKPSDLLTPLPASGFLSPGQAAQVCHNREVLAKFVVSASVKPTKIDEQCLRGISKDLIRDVINSKYANGLDSLSMLAKGSDLIVSNLKDLDNFGDEEEGDNESEEEENNLAKKQKSPSCYEAKSINTPIIMSNSSTNVQNDEMGFIKANEDVALMVGLPTDDKELDRIMDFTPNINVVGDIGQNVEDILQVIKSMEDVEESSMQSETIIPSGSSVDPGVVSGVEMFPEPLTSFERELLSNVDVDVMSLVNDNISMTMGMVNESTELQRENSLRTLQETVEQNEFENERRCAFLLRRLRKLQSQVIGRHVAEENTGVLELAHHSVKKYFLQELSNITPKGTTTKNLSEIGETLHAFLQKIEKSCEAQSNSIHRPAGFCQYFGGGSRDNVIGVSAGPPNPINRHPLFGTAQVKVDKDEVENVSGSLATQLHMVESNLDSDCTASSSGGESCDEMQNFNNSHQQPLPISKRAAWRWAQDRARVASRWTWLQAQISDLEYRIRHHNDMQRFIRTVKGSVVLETCEPVNGYSGTFPGSTGRSQENEQPSSRCRPFVRSKYGKRKLLRVEGLHKLSKRAARPSTIRCDCDHVLSPCGLCTGRVDPTEPHESLEQLSIPERIALVDPGYHPVLSFPDDVLHSTHFDAIMKSVEWQQKTLRGGARMTRVKDKDSVERRNKGKMAENKGVKYTSRMKKSSSSLFTARIKRKMLKGKRDRSGLDISGTTTPIRNLHGNLSSRKKISRVPAQLDDDDDFSAQSSSSKHSSPVPSPLQHGGTAEKVHQKERTSNSHVRLRQSSYDIDNIVIPYSVAASTRLERLQYKEILTPKWRICSDPIKTDVKNGVMHRPSQDSDVEDVSEETIALRHERSEREEYKRFMTYANLVPQHRIRSSRRADSRADSGANTPDPMSPHPSDFGGDVTSPITSPPATPSTGQDSSDHPNTLDNHRSSSLQNAIRRRTISSMRLLKEDTSTSLVDDENEVLPYDPRIFPLSEDVYDKMIEIMPDGHWPPPTTSLCERVTEKPDDEVEMESPESDTTESAYFDAEGEDPNDPEWTVAEGKDSEKERIRPTAKR